MGLSNFVSKYYYKSKNSLRETCLILGFVFFFMERETCSWIFSLALFQCLEDKV